MPYKLDELRENENKTRRKSLVKKGKTKSTTVKKTAKVVESKRLGKEIRTSTFNKTNTQKGIPTKGSPVIYVSSMVPDDFYNPANARRMQEVFLPKDSLKQSSLAHAKRFTSLEDAIEFASIVWEDFKTWDVFQIKNGEVILLYRHTGLFKGKTQRFALDAVTGEKVYYGR